MAVSKHQEQSLSHIFFGCALKVVPSLIDRQGGDGYGNLSDAAWPQSFER